MEPRCSCNMSMALSVDELDLQLVKKEEDQVEEKEELGEEVEQDEEVPPSLPDDVLLQVFEYLSVPELFAARLVCRRWAELALHQDAWRHREVCDREKGVLEAALRLAPCVGKMFLSFDVPESGRLPDRNPRLDVLVTTTRCAAEELVMNVDDCNAVTAASVVRNQAQLGRLRVLNLLMANKRGKKATLSARCKALMWTTLTTEGLSELSLTVKLTANFNPDWLPSERPRSSLKKLTCRLSDVSWFPIVLHLLECHADTLESLYLSGPLPLSFSANLEKYRPEAEAVASRVAGLRELECPLLRGMGALLKCSRLESLVLRIDIGVCDDVAVLSEAKEYLRKAAQLRKLTVNKWCYNDDTKEILPMAVDLVEALASSRLSALEVLTFGKCFFWNTDSADGALLDRLSDALGHLPALSKVYVDVKSADVLVPLMECVSRAAGSGRPLTLCPQRSLCDFSDFWCLHAWMHRETIKIVEILERCPSFHVLPTRFNCVMFRYQCPACLARCHQPFSFSRPDMNQALLFGHEEDAECAAPQHADRGVACYRLG